ncbi:hypothetical protein CNQ81_22955 [Bacillus cereus]|nr:hypothetical protein CNQ76_23450 [Bacillus cereus]PDR74708.1 hypothetical protein CNQ81_22955 [Bacillus cereus]PDR81907.1 hypothetical protein CNQ79_15825 [Bacillus cereus]PDR86720.1 hypothetical protein CNQ77_21310 [Bacillus cereus]PDR91966.1 hypothetical protein CNQ78_24685 [Bacillus cereus]
MIVKTVAIVTEIKLKDVKSIYPIKKLVIPHSKGLKVLSSSKLIAKYNWMNLKSSFCRTINGKSNNGILNEKYKI